MKKSFLHCLPALILLTFVAIAPAFPQKTQYKVAIFLYPGVELLDFAGPGEVFGATAGFDVFTVSADGEEILSQGFVTIKPEYSIATAQPADIMIFPGGSSGHLPKIQGCWTGSKPAFQGAHKFSPSALERQLWLRQVFSTD